MPDGGDPARCHRRHPDRQGSAGRDFRPRDRRAGRRRQQADPPEIPLACRGPGRKLPQDAAGDDARYSRDHDQAGGSPAQHAHPGRDAPGQGAADCARDPGYLRADRQPFGHQQHSSRARRAGHDRALAVARLRAARGAEKAARQSQGTGRGRRAGARRAPGAGRPGRRNLRPPEARLQHLPEDARQEALAVRTGRRVRLPHRGRQRGHLLPGARRGTQPVPPDARALQGLHRYPQGQRLPIAAHGAVRPAGRADRNPDPYPRDAPGRRGRHRRALALQRGQLGQRHFRCGGRVAAQPAGSAEEFGRLDGVPRARQGRPVPRRGLRVYPARAHHRAAQGLDGDRLCLRRALGCRQ